MSQRTAEFLSRFYAALPVIREWIEQTLTHYKKEAMAVNDHGYPGLARVYPGALLNRAKVVIIPGSVPVPPLSRMGLPELLAFEQTSAEGITYLDTFFVNRQRQSESLYFHELVHVVQWDVLGVDGFLLAYGAGLMEFGYRESPLEKMAYRLQADFERGCLAGNVVGVIREETEAIRAQLKRID